jgi:2'-5' RNA ligase
MVQSVELLLDPPSERAVTAQWSQLVDAGLPSQARHTGATNRPHITVAVARELDGDQEAAIATAVGGALPLTLRLGGLLVFGPGPFILARLVVPSTELLALQRNVVAAIGPTSSAFPHQQSGGWTAHVTLARRLTADQLVGALTILSPVDDLAVRAQAVRRWDGTGKVAWAVAEALPDAVGSAGSNTDEQPDDKGHDDGDGTQQ